MLAQVEVKDHLPSTMTLWWKFAWRRLSLTVTWAHRAWNLHHRRNLRNGIDESAEDRAVYLRMIIYHIQSFLSEGEQEYSEASDEESEQSSVEPLSDDFEIPELAKMYFESLRELAQGKV